MSDYKYFVRIPLEYTGQQYEYEYEYGNILRWLFKNVGKKKFRHYVTVDEFVVKLADKNDATLVQLTWC